MESAKIKVNDRVKRTNGNGCQGLVKDIRYETSTTGDNKEKPPMVVVFWDNGSQSYCAVEALEIVN